jgi:hypothetical protein
MLQLRCDGWGGVAASITGDMTGLTDLFERRRLGHEMLDRELHRSLTNLRRLALRFDANAANLLRPDGGGLI